RSPRTSSPSDRPGRCSAPVAGGGGASARAAVPPAPAELQADQAQAEPGHAGPQPPQAAGLLQAPVERQQRDERDPPRGSAHLDGANAVDVERRDVGDEERALAYLMAGGLLLGFHGTNPNWCSLLASATVSGL